MKYAGITADIKDYINSFRSTFNRWIDDIFLQFGVIIKCQRHGGYNYYIKNPEVIEENKLNKWLLDTLSTGNLIKESTALNNRIVVDNIPSGREYLSALIEAMKTNSKVEIEYRPFGKESSYCFPIAPYCVKMFENRWYVLARNNRNEIKIYGLDRIEKAEITAEIFELPKNFNAEDYFSKYFGIIIGGEEKPSKIVIRANEYHKHYMRTLPIHHSQELIKDYGEYADFELYLVPTFDFEMKLLQYGSMIEVLEPESLRLKMRDWATQLYEMYKVK